MPTFTAIALDRLLEPRPSKKYDDDEWITTSYDVNSPSSSRRFDIAPTHTQLCRRNTVASMPPKISPALYTTPESTPLPDSPTSPVSPSPYIINHKRRGPRLVKSCSDQNTKDSKLGNGHFRSLSEDDVHCQQNERSEEIELDQKKAEENARQEDEINGLNANVMVEETEDFFDPQESMSFGSSNDGDDVSGFMSAKATTPMGGDFFDAWEDLSSENGRQAQHFLADVETELREMRLSLLMEIEKRKQAEELLNSIRSQWQVLREKLGAVGLILPPELSVLSEDCQPDVDPTKEICQQIHLARFVSQSVGRGLAKADAEAEMEFQLQIKNFEIARLCDRLHYYEAMNREMSDRNQEAIEIARCERQKRRRRQKWIWGSIAATITLGSAALAWSYLPSGRGSSSSHSIKSPEIERDVQ